MLSSLSSRPICLPRRASKVKGFLQYEMKGLCGHIGYNAVSFLALIQPLIELSQYIPDQELIFLCLFQTTGSLKNTSFSVFMHPFSPFPLANFLKEQISVYSTIPKHHLLPCKLATTTTTHKNFSLGYHDCLAAQPRSSGSVSCSLISVQHLAQLTSSLFLLLASELFNSLCSLPSPVHQLFFLAVSIS